MKILEKYKNYDLVPGPVSDLYEARYDDSRIFVQFKDNFWFDRELEYYNILKDKTYCYELLDIDYSRLMVSFKYEDKNLSHLIYEKRIDESDYKQNVKDILCDLEKQGIMKINIYPWTFFIQNGKLKICDLYGCTTKSTLIPESYLKGVVNDTQRFPFMNGYLDCEATYNYTLEHSDNYWPEKI